MSVDLSDLAVKRFEAKQWLISNSDKVDTPIGRDKQQLVMNIECLLNWGVEWEGDR